ncbi:MAG: hypothetical protein RIG62_19050 [Cyclobacteriaceae bacterium]
MKKQDQNQNFEQLSLERKCRYILNHCTFVATRFESQGKRAFRINLYHRGSFYYEIWFNSDYHYIGEVRITQNRSIVDAYASTVQLQSLDY